MSNAAQASSTDEQTKGIIEELGEMSLATLLDEKALARIFDRSSASVRRAVNRGELPHPTKLFGKRRWTVEVILEHLRERLRVAEQEATEATAQMRDLSI